MAVLDTFFFIFDADASKLSQGLKSSTKEAEGVGVVLDALDNRAKKVGQAFVDLAKSAGTALAGVIAVGAVKRIVQETTDHTMAIRQQAQALALSTETVSAWGNAIRLSGGDANDAVRTLGNLKNTFVEMARFGGVMGPQGFMFLSFGLSNEDMKASINDPTIALGKLADTFSKLNAVQRQFVGQKLGFDQGTINLLSQGRRAFDEMIARQKELGVVTQRQADETFKFKMAQTELGIVFETVARDAVGALLPALTWLLQKTEGFVMFLREHSFFVKAFLTGLAVVFAAEITPAVASAAVALWAFLAPILAGPALVIALIAVFAALFDDVNAFMHGHDSILGELTKKWPVFGEVVRGVLSYIIESVKLLGATLWDLYKVIGSVMEFFVDVVTDGPKKAFDKLSEHTKGLFSDLKDHIKGFATSAQDSATAIGRAARGEGASGAPPSGDQTQRGQYISGQLQKMGWSKAQADGIAGSLLQESGGNEHAVNKTSGAEGLGQWLGSRKRDFEQYAGKPIAQSTLDEQIAFMNYELTRGKEQRAGNMLRAAQTPEEAARIHAQAYERPGAAEANIARREMLAESIAKGQAAIADTNNPISSQSSQSIANSIVTRGNTNVDVGGVNIHTQSSDPAAIHRETGAHLGESIKKATDYYDDGQIA